MTHKEKTMTPLIRAVLLGIPFLAGPVWADQSGHSANPDTAVQVQAGDLMITGAFARATLPGAPVGGAYLTIMNQGQTDDRLVAAAAPVGNQAQIHTMEDKDGVMTMRQLPDGLPVPAGATVLLKPGGNHLMLMGLTERLIEGDSLDLVLQFENAGEVSVTFDILALNARGPATHTDASHGAGN